MYVMIKKKNNSFKQAFPFIEAVIQEHMLDRKTEEEDEILDIDFLNIQEKPYKCHFEEQENSSDGKLSFAKKKIRILFLEINELRVHFMSNPIYLDLK